MSKVQPFDSAAGRTRHWWASVLAGQVDDPHPIYGADLDVAFKGGVLRLSGELPTETDKKELLNEARQFVGRAVDKIDAKHLAIIKRKERAGVLEQTLIAAFPNREVAEYARKYLVESRRVEPKELAILDSGKGEATARRLLPADFIDDVRKAFKAGEAVLILRVDETSAFKVRELLDEETRSLWTIATPPVAPAGRSA
jgi:hypothetical protein